jgi:hypothetical protein
MPSRIGSDSKTDTIGMEFVSFHRLNRRHSISDDHHRIHANKFASECRHPLNISAATIALLHSNISALLIAKRLEAALKGREVAANAITAL